ncbi:cell division protein ZipA [Marinobacter fuscus]|uniref:Cell division protein ZipA n=1 Tax=Marinobacter fuscus TaxID=2109942 RepID=A0A2T1K791_9GAMM|nr:cell division protein ZipA [Marinobacter fuscus]PSF05623.1 cell division protein ZipA [Marinobacter fuscus]
MSLREWLIAIGTLVIIGIVVDGLRRMRRARKESIAISSGMGADELKSSPLDEDYNPELPNGGARTVSRSTLEDRGYVTRDTSEPVVAGETDDVMPETGWGATDDYDDSGLAFDGDDGVIGSARTVSPAREDVQPALDTREGDAPVPVAQEAEDEPPLVTSEVQQDTARRSQVQPRRNQPLAGANRPEAKEVLVINVLSRSGETFEGTRLKSLFEACGLEHGDLDIYHRHESDDTTTPVQFSVANAVEPGTFRPEDVETLSTPGISFFMSLPGPTNALQAFEFMLETAQCVVRNLGGELKDERRSVMTPQTIEHCRQRIREFERKQRSQRPK